MSDDPELDRERRAFVPEAQPQQEPPKMADKDDLYLAEPEGAPPAPALTDEQRGAAFLAGLDGLIRDSAPAHARRLEAFKEGLGETHREVGEAEHAAAIGRDIREGDGFMKWGHTSELVGGLLENAPKLEQAPAEPMIMAGNPSEVEPMGSVLRAADMPADLDAMRALSGQEEQHEAFAALHVPAQASTAPELAAEFRAAAHDATMTAQNDREADVAAIIQGLEEATGLRETPEGAAYAEGWRGLGDQITSEPNPDKRAELRDVREALSHDYAAELADKAVTLLVVNGNQAGAKDMAKHADSRRMIAAQLRGEGPENDPARQTEQTASQSDTKGQGQAEPTAREQFIGAALEASGLRHSPRVEFVVEGPSQDAPLSYEDRIAARMQARAPEAGRGRERQSGYRTEDMVPPVRAVEGGQALIEVEPEAHRPLGYNIRPEMVVDVNGTTIQTTAKGREFIPDPVGIEPVPQHPDDHARLQQQAAESTKRQDAELAIAGGQDQPGGVVVSYEDRITARMEARTAEAEKSGNDRESIRDVAAAAFRSFGMR